MQQKVLVLEVFGFTGAKEEFESDFGKKILSDLGIDGDYEGIGHCAIGYAAVPAPASAPRKGNYVYYVK